MKNLAILFLILISHTAFASVSEDMATKIAKAYVLGIGGGAVEYVETTVDEELSNPTLENGNYYFMMHDAAGDCGFAIAVNAKSGEIIQEETFRNWDCY